MYPNPVRVRISHALSKCHTQLTKRRFDGIFPRVFESHSLGVFFLLFCFAVFSLHAQGPEFSSLIALIFFVCFLSGFTGNIYAAGTHYSTPMVLTYVQTISNMGVSTFCVFDTHVVFCPFGTDMDRDFSRRKRPSTVG